MEPPPDTDLPEDLFAALSGRIAEVSGIKIPGSKRWLLSARVAERVQATGARDVRGYVRDVLDAGGGAELGHLVELLRVGETQFFRHKGQLRAIRRVALPEIVARCEREDRKGVRAWSAGCATGEEPYTLAMMLEDELPAREGWRHDILATDLSETALSAARTAEYRPSSAHGVPREVAEWAIEMGEQRARISDAVRSMVRFERQNLLAVSYPSGFDLVLCRNVLIYFDRATQREVISRLARSVEPGGYLALGYAERLDSDEDALAPIRTDDGILYRRGAPDDEIAPEPMDELAACRRVRVSSRIVEREAPRRAEEVTAAERPEAPSPPAVRASTADAPALAGTIEGPTGVAVVRAVVARLLAREHPVLDLRELEYADEDAARQLARAAAAIEANGGTLIIVASAPGTLRFLRRHDVVPPARPVTQPPDDPTG